MGCLRSAHLNLIGKGVRSIADINPKNIAHEFCQILTTDSGRRLRLRHTVYVLLFLAQHQN